MALEIYIGNVARCCICAIGMLANLLVLFIVARYPTMRTACNVYVANLAVTDFAVSLLTLIQSIVVLSDPSYWAGDRNAGSTFYLQSCDVSRVIFFFLAATSILLLTVIAVERHKVITDPLGSLQHGTVKHAGRTCSVVWIVGALIAAIDTITRNAVKNDWTFTGASLNSVSCVFLKLETSDTSHTFLTVVVLLFFLFLYVLPSCIIIILYTRILVKVRQSRRLAVRETRSDDQAYLMVFVVTVFFLVAWLPIHIVVIINLIVPNNRQNMIASEVALLLVMLNSVANPFLYGLLGKNFRDKLKKMFCCKQGTRQIIGTTYHGLGQIQVTGSTGQAQATEGIGQSQATDGIGHSQAKGGTGQAQATSLTEQAQVTGGAEEGPASGGTELAQVTCGTGQAHVTGGTEEGPGTDGSGQAQVTCGTGQAQATGGTGQAQVTGGTGQAQVTGGTGQAQVTGGAEQANVTDGTEEGPGTDGTGQTQVTCGTGQAQAQATGGTGQAQVTGGAGQAQVTGGAEQANVTDGTIRGPGYRRDRTDPGYVRDRPGPGYRRDRSGPGYRWDRTRPGCRRDKTVPCYKRDRLGPGYVQDRTGPGYRWGRTSPS
ncbi:somatostatin receptor type 3-like [Branchiostoma floridae]|uniref:Somatostatin receptor type 3-like n=1 Tax=Branchiostoma floridae TaxID=7739 RepID=A0A9J7M136_BRAFL|nr:somatostatin receptor type 3-like [Branchiostoma floridae]